MKSPKLKALLALYVFIMAMGFVQSCCEEDYRITAMDGLFAEDSLGVQIDTVTGAFYLNGNFNIEMTTASILTRGLGNSAYATSCKETFINGLAENSFELVLNKSFLFEGDTVDAGENILLLEHINQNFNPGTRVFIDFTEAFFQNAQFENGNYTFTLNGRTTDDVVLSSSIELYLKL